jgi:hypothetical protein
MSDHNPAIDRLKDKVRQLAQELDWVREDVKKLQSIVNAIVATPEKK